MVVSNGRRLGWEHLFAVAVAVAIAGCEEVGVAGVEGAAFVFKTGLKKRTVGAIYHRRQAAVGGSWSRLDGERLGWMVINPLRLVVGLVGAQTGWRRCHQTVGRETLLSLHFEAVETRLVQVVAKTDQLLRQRAALLKMFLR